MTMCVLRRNEVYRDRNPLNQNLRRIVGMTDESVFAVKCSKEKQNSLNLPVAENRQEFENKVDKKELWVTADPYATRDSSRAGEEYLEQGRKNYQVINKYINQDYFEMNQRERAKVYKQMAQEMGCSVNTAKRRLSSYFTEGMTLHSVVPKFYLCGGRGSDKYSEKYLSIEDKAEMDEAIVKYLLNKGKRTHSKKSIKYAYGCFSAIYSRNHPDMKVPTYKQFYRYYTKNYNHTDILKAQHEDYEFESNEAIHHGSSISRGLGIPGGEVVTDATQLDIIPAMPGNTGEFAKHLWLTTIMDQATNLIVAINITLGKPAAEDFIDCLRNCMADKVEYCKQYGIEITEDQWPSRGLPGAILSDNGELASFDYQDAMGRLGITIRYAQPHRGDMKGNVERSHQTVNDFLRHLDGASNDKAFKDTRVDVKYTVEEITRCVIERVLQYNNTMGQTGKLTPDMLASGCADHPVDRWNYLIAKNQECGFLPMSDLDFIKNAYFREECPVTREGVLYRGFYYSSTDDTVRNFLKVAKDRKKKVTIAHGTKVTDVYLIAQPEYSISEEVYPLELNGAFIDWARMPFEVAKVYQDMLPANEEAGREKRRDLEFQIMADQVMLQDKPYPTPKKPFEQRKKNTDKNQAILRAWDGAFPKNVENYYLDDEEPDVEEVDDAALEDFFDDDDIDAFMNGDDDEI